MALTGSTIWHLESEPDIAIYADGTMTYTAGKSGDLIDTGRWWFEGDRYCRQWKKLQEGKKACFFVVLDGSTLKVFDLNGTLVQKAGFSQN